MTDADLVLHVGMQHSGADTLQHAFSKVRGQLRSRGVAYVGQRAIEELPSARHGWRNHDDVRADQTDVFAGELADLVGRELDATKQPAHVAAKTVLVSSDMALGRLDPGPADLPTLRPWAEPATHDIIAALRPRRVRIVIYVQRQDRLMELCYLSSIANGGAHLLPDQFPDRFKPVIDYVDLVERLKTVRKVDEVIVRPFELLGSDPAPFVDDFLDILGLRGQLDLTRIPPTPPAQVYTAQGMKAARAMNPFLDTEAERDRVRGFLMNHFQAGNADETRFLSDQARARMCDAYRGQNHELFGRFATSYPADSYDSDDATARLRLTTATGEIVDAQPERPAPAATPKRIQVQTVARARAIQAQHWARESARRVKRSEVVRTARAGLRRTARRYRDRLHR